MRVEILVMRVEMSCHACGDVLSCVWRFLVMRVEMSCHVCGDVL
jgi:hypothetical protein